MTADKPLPLVPKLRFPEFRDAPGWSTPRGDTLFDSINNRRAAPGLPVLAITQEHGAIPRDQIDYHVSVTAKSVASYKEVCEGDFIISLRSFQGGIEHSRYHGICSPAYVILRRKSDGNDHFFRHLFKSDRLIQQLTRNIEGIRDGKMISYAQFSEQLLPVPEPPEQQKIADCLGSLDDLIAVEGRKLEALRQHKQGLMQQLFPQPGETVPRLRFPEFANHSAWKPSKLEAIGQLSSGTTPARANPEFFDGGNIPWVKTKDLNNSLIDATEEHITARANARINPPGSILIAMYGGYRQIGRTGLLKIPAATNQAISVLVVDQGATLPVFVLAWLNARVGDWKRIASSSRKDPNITGADVASFPIRLPSIPEQRRTAACLAALDDHICAQDRKLYTLNQHKRGMLQQLFPSLKRRPK